MISSGGSGDNGMGCGETVSVCSRGYTLEGDGNGNGGYMRLP